MNIKPTIVTATPRKLKAVWSLETLEDAKKYHRMKAEDFVRTATDHIWFGYTISDYIKICGVYDYNQYRPRTTIEVKVTSWYIEALGENNE